MRASVMSDSEQVTAESEKAQSNRDRVYLKGLKVDTVIGVYDWERAIRQTVVIDIEMATDAWSVAIEDQIDKAVDYAAVTKRVKALVSAAECRLIETLAERVAEAVLSEFGVNWVRVSLAKPGALEGVKEVGVVIERSAE